MTCVIQWHRRFLYQLHPLCLMFLNTCICDVSFFLTWQKDGMTPITYPGKHCQEDAIGYSQSSKNSGVVKLYPRADAINALKSFHQIRLSNSSTVFTVNEIKRVGRTFQLSYDSIVPPLGREVVLKEDSVNRVTPTKKLCCVPVVLRRFAWKLATS